jgi:long-chain acyl-CoA synthetase
LPADKGVSVKDYAELSRRSELREAVQAVVDRVNREQPPYATLKKFALVDREFSQETGELTPTLKVKRKFATQKYKSILDGLYTEAAL